MATGWTMRKEVVIFTWRLLPSGACPVTHCYIFVVGEFGGYRTGCDGHANSLVVVCCSDCCVWRQQRYGGIKRIMKTTTAGV